MKIALITGAAGLIGSEAVRFLSKKGFSCLGVDNDMRKQFFGNSASVKWNQTRLEAEIPGYHHFNGDIRDEALMGTLFSKHGSDIKLVIHTAAQPSHDWAAKDPMTDFTVNAGGTLILLEQVRKHCPKAVFIFTSTNKVYGDRPNTLPLIEKETRWELDQTHPFFQGVPETMSLDACLHSLFGVSKLAADVYVQEYGRYFGIKTGVFRGGCLTGPNHSGAELHGFLAYLVQCAVRDTPYHIFGYLGKQVRDHIHSFDLLSMFWHFFQNPRSGEVYNVGGGRHSNCSLLEATHLCEELFGKKMKTHYKEENRIGDHKWWISDIRKFQNHYPNWTYSYDLKKIIKEIAEKQSSSE